MAMTDDGYSSTLRRAQVVCGVLFVLPATFLAVTWAYLRRPVVPHEEPVLVAIFVMLTVFALAGAPFVRERLVRNMARVRIEGRVNAPSVFGVYTTFSIASIVAYLMTGVPALFGFLASLLTTGWVPVLLGCTLTLASWAMLWPRDGLWRRWTWQARLREPAAEASDPTTAGDDAQG